MLNYIIPCSSLDVTADSIVYVIIAIQKCVYLVLITVRMQPVRTTDRCTSLKTRVCLADEQIPCTTWKSKFHFIPYTRSPFDHIPIHMNLIGTLKVCVPMIRFNNFLFCNHRFWNLYFPINFFINLLTT